MSDYQLAIPHAARDVYKLAVKAHDILPMSLRQFTTDLYHILMKRVEKRNLPLVFKIIRGQRDYYKLEIIFECTVIKKSIKRLQLFN